MKDRPLFTYVALALIILGAFYFIYYKPKGKELKTLRKERTKIENDVRKSLSKKLEVDKIETELKSMNVTLKELEAIIPKAREISDIFKKIQQLADDSQLNIKRFAPQGETSKEFYSEWPISIEMNGNYHNLGYFFDRLSRFSRLFNVVNFSLNSLSKQSEASTIKVKCTAKTYIFLEQIPEKKGK